MDDSSAEQRILFLGDSFVEGFGVPVDKRASSLLEADLRGSGYSDVRLMNAGQLATNPISYFENLVSFGIALKPKVVIVGLFMGNDFMDSRAHPTPTHYSVGAGQPRQGREDSIENSPLALGYLRRLVVQTVAHTPELVRNVQTDRFWDFYFKEQVNRDFYMNQAKLDADQFANLTQPFAKDILEDFLAGRLNPSYLLNSLHAMQYPDDNQAQYYSEADYSNVLDILSEMNRICTKRGISLLVVVFPDAFQVMPQEYTHHLLSNLHLPGIPSSLQELGPLRARLVSDMASRQILFRDLTDSLSKSDYYLFDGHLTESGQLTTERVIRQAVITQLRQH